jgi:hypothetical protein
VSKKKRKHPAPAADKYITISVAEYVFLVKLATLLQVTVNDGSTYSGTLAAVKDTIEGMQRMAEGGGDK